MLGLISDVSFMRQGQKDPLAGIRFANHVRALDPYLPIIVESTESTNGALVKTSTAFSSTRHRRSSPSTSARP